MDFYRYGIISGITSVVILIVIILSPQNYFIIESSRSYMQVGDLFPVLLLSWLFSTIALAFNFIYIERLHMNVFIPVARHKKFLPSILSVPSFISFLWFCYQLCKLL
ncbi:MAG: hypothetical protein WKF35_05760 [Ferruginibacter sp.]